jgi:hypothetical protein
MIGKNLNIQNALGSGKKVIPIKRMEKKMYAMVVFLVMYPYSIFITTV